MIVYDFDLQKDIKSSQERRQQKNDVHEQQFSMEDADVMDDDDNQGFAEGNEEILDMDEFEESGMLDLVDPSVATTTNKVQNDEKFNKIDMNNKAHATNNSSNNTSNDSVLRTRTYDLHITYDKYYQTPRLWVIGYDEVNTL